MIYAFKFAGVEVKCCNLRIMHVCLLVLEQSVAIRDTAEFLLLLRSFNLIRVVIGHFE